MMNSHLNIYHLNRGDTERVKRDSISSEGDGVWTPSLCTSESESSYSDSDESIAQVQLSLDRSIKNGSSSSDTHEKPSHSYIAMISMAILSKPNRKLLLNDIYQYIMDNFPFFNNKEKAWRNSIRHNLSLNECFLKCGRSNNGKGNYWSIHLACIADFSKGDFRRRNARRRARKSSVKTADDSSNKFYTRNNNGYVPMTSSQIGFYPYSYKESLMHTKPHNPHQIIQSPVSTFEMIRTQFPAVMQSFGSDSLFPVSQSGGQSCITPSTYCTSSSFRPSSSSTFYSSCQIQKEVSDW
ncbi:forkhead box protein I3-like [Mytilus californianus]|uniref:forkhead box protein I3-like n=1 Tax=Mytilus californianus TaxID=6549 RepID=UPI002247E6F5|nr:forkhead box protein I3-like [Mytilus californianus]